MKTFKAKVKFPAKEPKEGQYGPYISIGVIPAGEMDDKANVVNIFGNPEDEYMKGLHWKQEVTVLKDEKGRYKLIEETAQAAPQDLPSVGLTTMNREEKLRLDADLQAFAKLHRRCFDLAAESMQDSTPQVGEEVIQKVATTLFIQISRKFNL